ncbi:GH12486 [Drosophila grimshawi]|uniref:GH12486 n=1 Tax=Drosophila grimshawi TaxID=7222 RepID=B4JJG6_DROGR|nr:GH12486 [Drosophila grimshawi]
MSQFEALIEPTTYLSLPNIGFCRDAVSRDLHTNQQKLELELELEQELELKLELEYQPSPSVKHRAR